MPSTSRLPNKSRLQSDVHRLLTILMQRDLNDPRLSGVTITDVVISKNSQSAVVKVHHLDKQIDPKDCIERLNRLASHFEHHLRRSLQKKRMPKLQFRWDKALEEGNAVIDLINALNRPEY